MSSFARAHRPRTDRLESASTAPRGYAARGRLACGGIASAPRSRDERGEITLTAATRWCPWTYGFIIALARGAVRTVCGICASVSVATARSGLEYVDGLRSLDGPDYRSIVVPVASHRVSSQSPVLGIALALSRPVHRTRGLHRKPSRAPATGSEAYEQATRQFYRGLAQLQVGLIDTATQEFTHASRTGAQASPPRGRTSAWRICGSATSTRRRRHRARRRPSRRRTATSRFYRAVSRRRAADRDEGLVDLRRAVDLDARNLPARTALIEEVENARRSRRGRRGAAAARSARGARSRTTWRCSSSARDWRPSARTRRTLRDAIARLQAIDRAWPPDVVEQLRAVQQASRHGDVFRRVARSRVIAQPRSRRSRRSAKAAGS